LSLSSVIAKLVESSSTRKSLDEDDLFGELVTAELKKMKSGEKESVKMELSKILYCRRSNQQ
jgi:predicted CopG family antitoxin